MPPRLESVLQPPLAFADGGAAMSEQGDTLEAFALALRLGASGIASGARGTADNATVVTRDVTFGRSRFRRKQRIDATPLGELPRELATLEVVLEQTNAVPMYLEVDDDAALEAALSTVRTHQERHGVAIVDHIWFANESLDVLRRWRDLWPTIGLCAQGRLASLPAGPERWVADLAAAGVDAARMPHPDWTGGLAALCHRFEVLAFAGPADHAHQLDDLLRMGVDAVSSAHVDRLVDAMARAGW